MSADLVPVRRSGAAIAPWAPDEPRSAPTGAAGVLAWARRWRWTILGSFAAVVVVVDLATLAIPTTFHSEVSFLVEPRTPQALSPALSVLERLGSAKSTETEIELLRSRRVVEPVVEELALHVEARVDGKAVPATELFPAFAAPASARPGVYRLRPSADGVEALREDGRVLARGTPGATLRFANLTVGLPTELPGGVELRVEPFGEVVARVRERVDPMAVNPDADVIRLACAARTAEDAQRLCRGVSESYLRMRGTLQRVQATATADFLSGQVEQIGAQLAAAEDELRGYERANRVVALEERASEGVRQFAQLKAQRDQLAAERDALVLWLGAITADGRDPSRFRELASFPTLFRAQSQTITQLLGSLVELENRRSELRVVRAASSPEVTAVDERIRQIEAQLRELASGYERALAAQISALDRLLEQSGQELSVIPSQQIASARLQRQVSLLEELYRFLQTRLQEAEVAQAVNLPSVRIVDEASLPYRPSWPSVPLNLAIGVVLGLGVAILAGLFREYTDRRIRERDELERVTGISVLGLVPHVPSTGPVVPVRAVGTPASNGVAPFRESEEQEIALEAFRSIWTDIGFLMARDDLGPIRTIAVTSASRAEGKTFTTCNLAAARAERGVRTLLVDADIRGSGVARFFDLPPRQPGVSDVLAGRAEAAAAIRELIVGDRQPLHVLPAGSPTSRSAELIESSRFDQMLAGLVADHELVIIDTPPLNVLTDAASIAARVDAVIVVVRGETTEQEALRHTLERLRRANGRVIGLVLNDTRLPHHYRSYSYVETARAV
jgi:capsular exopolysaccharide synthesis family protein